MESKTHKLISSIRDLSLAGLMDCMCDHQYDVLVLEGNPTDFEKYECWSMLYVNYLELLDDAETIYLYTLQKEVEILNFKIVLAESIVGSEKQKGILEFYHVQFLVDTLKEFGFKVKSLKADDPNYTQGLASIKSRIQHLKLIYQEKISELEVYQQDKKGETVSRVYFDNLLSRLKKFMGSRYDPNIVMVPEFVADLKQFLSQTNKNPVKDEEG